MDTKIPPKPVSRRKFLESAATLTAAMVLPGVMGCTTENIDEFLQKHFVELSPAELEKVVKRMQKQNEKKYGKAGSIDATPAIPGVLFGYGLDISRCIGCRRCVHACVKENNQSRDPDIQWIRVLEFNKESGIDFAEADPYYCTTASLHDKEASHHLGEKKEGEAHGKAAPVAVPSADAPMKLSPVQKSILENPDSQYPLYQVDANKVPASDPACKVPRPGHFYVPVACQQCENPPCVKVCPVKATWKDPDGIVVIDYNWCIGCRYCMAACPYGARHFNWTEPKLPAEDFNPDTHYLGNRPRPRGVVEKCTFCIQRTRKGQYPACVEICPVGARKFGNLLDPASEIRQIMERKRVLILKNELNTKPKFFYFYGTAT